MNKITMALATAGIFALSGCVGGTGGDETGETGSTDICPEDPSCYEGPWQINSYDWSCSDTDTGGDGSWSYEVITDGWADDVSLDIHETGSTAPWSESHTMTNSDFADDGTWDEWTQTLTYVSTVGAVVSGSTSLFECGFHGADSLAWMATMDAGSNGTDCGIWGYQAADYWNTSQGNSCYDFDAAR